MKIVIDAKDISDFFAYDVYFTYKEEASVCRQVRSQLDLDSLINFHRGNVRRQAYTDKEFADAKYV